MQPEITTFASELLPLLFQYLSKASQEAEKNPRGLTKSYYALETFCENLGTYIQSVQIHVKILNIVNLICDCTQ